MLLGLAYRIITKPGIAFDSNTQIINRTPEREINIYQKIRRLKKCLPKLKEKITDLRFANTIAKADKADRMEDDILRE